MAGSVLDDHRLCSRLSDLRPGAYCCSLTEAEKFNPEHWALALSLAGGSLRFRSIIPRDFPVLDLFISKMALRIGLWNTQPVFVGIDKKGMGLVYEIGERVPALKDSPKFLDTKVTKEAVSGKDVLIIDDIVNTGTTLSNTYKQVKTLNPRTIHSFVLLGRADGMAKLRELDVQVDAALEVPVNFFSMLFIQWVSPLLRRFKNGAISNRPHRIYTIDGDKVSVDQLLFESLRGLVAFPQTEVVNEIPSCDGSRSSVYHGTVELSEDYVGSVLVKVPNVSSIDQAKVRFFIGPSTPLHLHLCGIAWTVSSDGSVTGAEGTSEIAADIVLDDMESYMTTQLRERGLRMRRADRGTLAAYR